jgi:cellulase
MVHNLPCVAFLCLGLVAAQTPGNTPERHPELDTWECSKKHGCKKQKSYVVIDQASHPVHQLKEPNLNCGNWGSAPNVTVCPDEKTCAKNCIVEGIPDYSKVGVTTKGGNLYLKQLDEDGNLLSPRVYLLDENNEEYKMLKLTGREFSFDVDTSKLPCGLNGALYLSEMDKTGGKSKLNPGGAYYGSGYCDAQCFTFPFIEGVVSSLTPTLRYLENFLTGNPGQHRRQGCLL